MKISISNQTGKRKIHCECKITNVSTQRCADLLRENYSDIRYKRNCCGRETPVCHGTRENTIHVSNCPESFRYRYHKLPDGIRKKSLHIDRVISAYIVRFSRRQSKNQ